MLKGATKLLCIAASSFMTSNYLNELLETLDQKIKTLAHSEDLKSIKIYSFP
jgi:hypothetical protein